jgi:hypothetical protein
MKEFKDLDLKIKSFVVSLLTLLLIILLIPGSRVSADGTTSDLLSGKSLKIINIATGVQLTDIESKPSLGTTDEVTDGNMDSYYELERRINNSKNTLVYSFSEPKVITGYKLKTNLGPVYPSHTSIGIYVFDTSGQRYYFAYPPNHTGVEITLPSPISNVLHVVLFQSAQDQTIKTYDFQLFGGNQIELQGVAGNAVVSLSWSEILGSAGYEIKRSMSAGGPYTVIATNVTGNSYQDNEVINGTTYFYVVSAEGATNGSIFSNEVSVTPQETVEQSNSNKAILVITLLSGLEKEYYLPMSEVNNFISWYNSRANGVGLEAYYFNKDFNKANSISREDHIVFDKIEAFELNEYTPAP